MLGRPPKKSGTNKQRVGSPRSPLNVVTKDQNRVGTGPMSGTGSKVGLYNPGGIVDKLSVLNHPNAVPCLPFAGEQLSGLSNATLPFTSDDHDLVNVLSLVVLKETAHPKRDTSELVSTILSTQLLTQITMVEMKNHGISMKAFASALNTNPATFSLSLREPRHWFDTSPGIRKNYYSILLWLNLPTKERRASFRKPNDNEASDDETPSPVENVPNLSLLSGAILKELKSHNLDFGEFVQKIARYPNECVIRNLLLTPMPWELLSASLRKRYALMWYWMKQSTVERLKVFNIEYNEDNNNEVVVMEEESPTSSVQVDTNQIVGQVLDCLQRESISVEQFSERILRLPSRLVGPLMRNPSMWDTCKNHEKCAYVAMLKYLGRPTDNLSAQIDTREVAKDILRFLREHGISMFDFASKVVKVPKGNLFGYLNSPVPWSGATEQQQTAFIIISHWLELPKEEKLSQFYPQASIHDPSPGQKFHNQPKRNESPRAALQAVVDDSKISIFGSPDCSLEYVDTVALANDFINLLDKNLVNLKNFAGDLGVNRTILGSLLKQPLPWEECTKFQKFIFLATKKILQQNVSTLEPSPSPTYFSGQFNVENASVVTNNSPFYDSTVPMSGTNSPTTPQNIPCISLPEIHPGPFPSSPMFPRDGLASTPTATMFSSTPQDSSFLYPSENGSYTPFSSTSGATSSAMDESSSGKEKKKRQRLTEYQFNFLKEFFQKNQRPSTQEKKDLSETLGLTMRKVVVFFSNHRVRGFGKRYPGKAPGDASPEPTSDANSQCETLNNTNPESEIPNLEISVTIQPEKQQDSIE